jgi:3-oxoacyl-[acyl-carrier-protein] synthase III
VIIPTGSTGSRVLAFGGYQPERVLTNDELATIVDTNDEWIRSRVGIAERRVAAPDETTLDMATHAAGKALAGAGVSPDDIDLVIVATCTGESVIPNVAAQLAHRLGIPAPGAFDVNAACAGFSYGLASATAFVQAGMADTILLAGAEIFSRILDFTDRTTSILFGDGAGAVIVQASDRPGIEGTVLGADGTAAEILQMPAGGTRTPASHETVEAHDHTIRMPKGREVFKRAVTEMASACRELLEKSGHTPADVDVLIPHQANARIMIAVAERLGVPAERSVLDVAEVGNTSAASIPIALARAWNAGRIREGDLVLFTSFGAGLTWGATLVRWTMPEPPA